MLTPGTFVGVGCFHLACYLGTIVEAAAVEVTVLPQETETKKEYSDMDGKEPIMWSNTVHAHNEKAIYEEQTTPAQLIDAPPSCTVQSSAQSTGLPVSRISHATATIEEVVEVVRVCARSLPCLDVDKHSAQLVNTVESVIPIELPVKAADDMRNPAAQPKLFITTPGTTSSAPSRPRRPGSRSIENNTSKRDSVPAQAAGLICLDTDETLSGFEATLGLLRQNALDEAAYIRDQDFTNESPSVVAVWENYLREVEHLHRAFFRL
ncbi:hypothetical protein JCM11641_006132 [Rhodosporidiobolus odoratus]